ncbi:putative tRNA pseudouridine synthase Pus10 [Condylostylus longicornis]|uniref:putative tRNA pseudouridine synthase Pus10 n=1 Tax=Condylostylus longicornis TaxID=2530218 RepID=UPI00244E5738|nr:putative tRNA pseudouridine synthase Pus10 [Condylostylus longicornis]
MTNQEIYDFLKTLNCCNICCLRYLKARGDEYEQIERTFKDLGVVFKIESSGTIGSNIKKFKPNICSVCFDVFSNSFLDSVIDSISKSPEINKFQCDKVVTAISLPTLFYIRQLSIWLLLCEKFPSRISREKPPDVPIKEAIKLIMNPRICRALGKSYDTSSNLGVMINITLNHKSEQDEIEKMSQFICELKLEKTSKHRKRIVATRGLLEKCFTPTKVSLNEFQKYFNVLLEIPIEAIYLESISFAGPTVFLAGRYRKLSRNLPHSPWILDGQRVLEESIQEIIIENISEYFGTSNSNIIFSSSGREDVDVRCLGNGRPFVLEIPDSKVTNLSLRSAAQMEFNIEKSKKISVINLQMVNRDELIHIKSGEENKKKIYRALCVLGTPVTIEILKKLNMPNGFITQQKTPIRVLHRRPLHTRPKIVHSVQATISKDKKNILILDLTTQAGCYIKELVHGEFGRTHPSISSIINQPVDIIALDVIGIDLDWPKNIDNRQYL